MVVCIIETARFRDNCIWFRPTARDFPRAGAGVKRDVGIGCDSMLETGCLLTPIRPFATNPNAALVKTPKFLWMDCGLAASLAGTKTPAEARTRPGAGFWLEQTLF